MRTVYGNREAEPFELFFVFRLSALINQRLRERPGCVHEGALRQQIADEQPYLSVPSLTRCRTNEQTSLGTSQGVVGIFCGSKPYPLEILLIVARALCKKAVFSCMFLCASMLLIGSETGFAASITDAGCASLMPHSRLHLPVTGPGFLLRQRLRPSLETRWLDAGSLACK